MEKIIVIYRQDDYRTSSAQLDYASLAKRLDRSCHAVSLAVRGEPIAEHLLPERALQVCYDDSISCVCSLWLDSVDRLPSVLLELSGLGQPYGIYLVTESIAREYSTITWKAGEQSPGVTIFAMLRKKREHTLDEFAKRWKGHEQLSLRLHPLVRYHRNFTFRTLAGKDGWDGFTDERVGADADLSPERYCSEGMAGLQRSYEDLIGFVNMPNDIRCVYLRERILKFPSWIPYSVER